MVIPIFTAQLEKAREATDLANIRAAYAECESEVLANGSSKTVYKEVAITQTKAGWSTDVEKVGGKEVSSFTYNSPTKNSGNGYVTVTSNGVFDFVSAQPTGENVINVDTLNND